MKRFAVAVDLIEEAPERVMDVALPWMQPGATLDLLHVEGHRFATDWVSDPNVRKVVEAEADAHRRAELVRLDALLDRIPEASRGRARLLEGSPVPALVSASADYDALMIATRGRSGLSHFWLGSIAERVVRGAVCVVIVLRMPTV